MSMLAVVFLNLALIAILMWLFDSLYCQLRVDLYRSELFRVRDDLFEAAERGEISFDSPAYRMTRQMLNGMIRFANEMSLCRMVLILITRKYWLNPNYDRAFSISYGRAVNELSLVGQSAVNTAMRQAHMLVAIHVLHTSIFTFPLVIAVKTVTAAGGQVHRGLRLFEKVLPRDALTMVDHGAYLIGDPSQRVSM
jgi:hypothetical protein